MTHLDFRWEKDPSSKFEVWQLVAVKKGPSETPKLRQILANVSKNDKTWTVCPIGNSFKIVIPYNTFETFEEAQAYTYSHALF